MKKGFFSIFKAELLAMLTSPRLVFLMILVPVGLFLYYASLLKQGVPEKLPIALYDQDGTKTSRQLTQMLDASSTLDIVSEVSSQLEGERAIKTDEVMAFIIIPADFEKDLFKGNSTQVVCFYNGQYILAGSLINKAFQTVVGTFAAGAHIKSLMQKGQTTSQAYVSTSPVNIDTHILFNPYTSYSYYLTLSLMPMALQIVIMVISIYVLGSVLKQRKGRELFVASRGNIWVAFWGKILPYTLLFSIIGFFMNSLLYYKIGIPLRGSFLVVNLYLIVFVVVCQLISLFFVSVCTSLRAALTLGGGYAAIAFSFAGYTFPEEGMPLSIQYLNYIFPFTSYLRLTVDYAIRGIPFNSFNLRYIIAFIIFCGMGLSALPFYNRLLKKGGYYA